MNFVTFFRLFNFQLFLGCKQHITIMKKPHDSPVSYFKQSFRAPTRAPKVSKTNARCCCFNKAPSMKFCEFKALYHNFLEAKCDFEAPQPVFSLILLLILCWTFGFGEATHNFFSSLVNTVHGLRVNLTILSLLLILSLWRVMVCIHESWNYLVDMKRSWIRIPFPGLLHIR